MRDELLFLADILVFNEKICVFEVYSRRFDEAPSRFMKTLFVPVGAVSGRLNPLSELQLMGRHLAKQENRKQLHQHPAWQRPDTDRRLSKPQQCPPVCARRPIGML